MPSFVMSCRVFQRQTEIIFLLTILRGLGLDYLSVSYRKTMRNEPFRLFLSKFFGAIEDGSYEITPQLILDAYPSVQDILKVKGSLV